MNLEKYHSIFIAILQHLDQVNPQIQKLEISFLYLLVTTISINNSKFNHEVLLELKKWQLFVEKESHTR